MNNRLLRCAVIALGVISTVTVGSAQAWDWTYFESDARVEGGFGFGPDGSAYLLSSSGDTGTRLRRIAPDGSLAWEREFSGHSVTAGEIQANDARVCAAVVQGTDESASNLRVSVICFDAASGIPLWRADSTADVPQLRPLLGLAADNSVSLIFATPAAGGTVRRINFSAAGPPTVNVVIPAATSYSEEGYFVGDGSVLVNNTAVTPTEHVLVAADGGVTARFSPASLGLAYIYPQLAPDGTVFVLGVQRIATIGNRTIALRLASNGMELWRNILREEEYVPFPIVFGDHTVYFALSHDATPGNDFAEVEPPHAYFGLEYTNGTELWDVDVAPNRQAFFTGVLNQDETALVNAQSLLNSKFRVQTRDTSDGTILLDTEQECGRNSCSKMLTHVDAAGTLRIIGRLNTDNAHAVYALSRATLAPPSVVIDQPGIRGGWSVNTNGQGIAFDFDPATRTLFAPWFTMSYRAPGTSQTTTVADLHWYTLQATLPQNTRIAAVTIYETAGGSFATGAPIAPVRVGEGTLTFNNCNEGTLLYSFDTGHNGGAQGLVGLSRLTTRTDPCTDALGEIDPPEATPAEGGGFRIAYSGSWSQVGSSGQGLELIVQPTVGLFGAWFTFDPQNIANDDKRHHWFTLQGSLGGASNGTITLPLYQTTGGTFDFRPSLQTVQVGTATITFQSCLAATLDYAFGAAAGNFSNTSGSIALEHLGGCIGE